MTNLEIADKLVICERSLLGKISSVSQHGKKILNEGIELNDMAKRNEGTFMISVSSTSFYLSNFCGKYITAFFIQSIMKDRYIDNDLLSNSINELTYMNKEELNHYINSNLDLIEEFIVSPIFSEDALKLILDYGDELKNLKLLVNESI